MHLFDDYDQTNKLDNDYGWRLIFTMKITENGSEKQWCEKLKSDVRFFCGSLGCAPSPTATLSLRGGTKAPLDFLNKYNNDSLILKNAPENDFPIEVAELICHVVSFSFCSPAGVIY